MITLEPGSGIPPFEQIKAQVTQKAASGELPAHSKLPTVRQLAELLHIAPNTVAKAYRELEQSGIIETRGRNGSFITENALANVEKGKRNQALNDAAGIFSTTARQLGASQDDAIQALVRAFSRD